MGDAPFTLTLRKGHVCALVDITGKLTQKQWDAVGALMVAVETLESRLNAYPERADITS